jgi:hypothetical protein
MLPEGRLSSQNVPALSILGGRSLTGTLKQDFEDGPIELNDPSAGLYYQIWQALAHDGGVRLYDADEVGTEVLTTINITEMSFTFDQNGRPSICFTQYGQTKIYWFDSSLGGVTITTIGSGIGSPKVILDDKRSSQSGNSDIIMGYIKNEQLCYRQQRDRFLIEYVLATNVVGRLQKLGMGNNLRLQFVIGNY